MLYLRRRCTMSICTNCIHWIGDPVNYCELGPNQHPSCLQAETEALEQVAEAREAARYVAAYDVYLCGNGPLPTAEPGDLCLYEVEVTDPAIREIVGTQYVVASSWEEAIREAGPHWPARCHLRASQLNAEQLAEYLDYHCP